MKRFLPCLVIACAGVATLSLAQQYAGGPVYEYHASTAAEGYARGMADVIRSAGEANLRNSEAANNYEEARSKNFDNRLKYTNTYFEQRRLNAEYRAAERRPRPSSEQLFRLAASGVPDRLSPGELDPLSGKIAWPAVLRLPAYDQQRAKLDALFAKRAEAQISAYALYGEIRATADELLNALKANITDYPANAYLTAKQFVERLAYEARFMPSA